MKRPHLALLDMLDVAVTNRRWSWGGTAPDGSLVLILWQDERHASGRLFAFHPEGGEESAGHPERLRHLMEIRSGKPGFAILALPVDPSASPREVRQVSRLLYPITQAIEEEDGCWTVERGTELQPEEWKKQHGRGGG